MLVTPNNEKFHGRGFKRAVVKKMVLEYRKNSTAGALKYSHFNAFEILQLMIKNEVIPKTLASAIASEMDYIKQFGVKIYLGNHVEDITLPQTSNSTPGAPVYNRDYLRKTTTILCNTVIEHGIVQEEFKDMLNDKDTFALAINDDINRGEGLDQAEIEPPYHTFGDECYDVGSSTPGTCD